MLEREVARIQITLIELKELRGKENSSQTTLIEFKELCGKENSSMLML